MLILSEAHLRAILIEYQVHYNTAAPGHRPARPGHRTRHPPRDRTDVDIRQIRRKPVLNGLINEYVHAA